MPVACLGLVGLGALSWRGPKLRGTTLVAPWVWSLVALASLAATEILIALSGSPPPEWAAQLRFAAAVSTFCPAMALFGAKRPQNRGWQLVVLSLWAILSLPSIEWLLFGGLREIHPARCWFLAVLMAVGAANGLGTRYWPSSLLYCGGQLALVAPFISAQAVQGASLARLAGMSALVLAWLLIAAELPRRRAAAWPLDRAWLDFRDGFGAVWALRVAERMNASASMYDWPLTLTWRGFVARPSGATAGVPSTVEESLRTLLRRFVSPDWIDARLGQSARDPNVITPVA
ncbi:MAG: hypothetical protein WD063_11875 [Pirellulales bacterium]